MTATITAAVRAVAKAINSGVLPPVVGQDCDDCGAPAAQYDHRDYTQPLKVAPVCRSCNLLRGHADVWPGGFDPRPRVRGDAQTSEVT